jgi:hypothetical protein
MRATNRQEEAMHPLIADNLIWKWALDIIYILIDRAHKYIVVGRDNFSRWCKACSLSNLKAKQIADFI